MTYQLIQNVTIYDIQDQFIKMDRAYFSLEALKIIINELTDGGDKPLNLDVIAICCDWHEYDEIDYLINDYAHCLTDDLEDEDGELDKDKILDDLNHFNVEYYELDNGNLLVRQ